MKKALIGIVVIIAVVVVAFVIWSQYAATHYAKMAGGTMEPTFYAGDILKVNHDFTLLNRGDVIVLKLPTHPDDLLVKRVIGLPGEQVAINNGLVQINGVVLDEKSYFPRVPSSTPNLSFSSLQLGDNEYFVLGDNRAQSFDSRSWGPLPRADVVSKVTGKL
jgi:signal peptidase I